jgi:excisionase family DNA binding protein
MTDTRKPTPRSDSLCLLSVVQVAEMLGVHPRSIRRLVWRGELGSIRLGRRTLISLKEVRRFLRVHTRPSTHPDAPHTGWRDL